MLALNVLDRSFLGLLEPLDAMQAAPVGFLWSERLAVLLLGESERALRLFPLLCGLAGLVLFRRLALRLLAPGAALLAIAVFALNSHAIFFANDVKQYSSDALATIAIVLAATRGGALRLLFTGGIALLFSHPACFVLAGVGGARLLDAAMRRDRRELLRSAVIALVWVGLFLIAYRVSLQASDEGALREFWDEAFLPLPPRSAKEWLWYVKYPMKLFRDPCAMQPPVLIAVLCGLGCGSLWRRARTVAVTTIAVLLLPLFASSLHLYPYKGRFLLFLTPLVTLATAEAATLLWKLADRVHRDGWRKAARVTATLLIVAHPAFTSLPSFAVAQIRNYDLSGAMAAIASDAHPGDVLCSAVGDAGTEGYYERQFDLPRRGVTVRTLPDCEALLSLATSGHASNASSSSSAPDSWKGRRVWFLFRVEPDRDVLVFWSRQPEGHAAATAAIRDYMTRIESIGTLLDHQTWFGLELFLVQL